MAKIVVGVLRGGPSSEYGVSLKTGENVLRNLPQEKYKPLDIFMGYAKELNLDEAKFKSSVDSNKFKDKIDGDTYDGNQAGVDATPTFFINGIKYTGSYSYDDVKKALDDAMRKK